MTILEKIWNLTLDSNQIEFNKEKYDFGNQIKNIKKINFLIKDEEEKKIIFNFIVKNFIDKISNIFNSSTDEILLKFNKTPGINIYKLIKKNKNGNDEENYIVVITNKNGSFEIIKFLK